MAKPGDAALLALIDAAYTAAEEPQAWESFLAALSRALGGNAALLLHHDLRGAGQVAVSTGLDPDIIGRYNKYYHHIDPLATSPRAQALAVPGTAVLDHMLLSRGALKSTEYYVDFLSRTEQKRTLTLTLQPPPAFAGISVYRDERDEPFGSDESRFVETLAPHVLRALQIHERLFAPRLAGQGALDALDEVACAVFVVDKSARVLFANRMGRDLLAGRRGLCTENSVLTTDAQDGTRKLRALCTEVATSRLQTRHPGRAIAVRRRCSTLALQILVAPLTPAASSAVRSDVAGALVFASDPTFISRPCEAMLQVFYGFTPTEARIAARIGEGETLEEIAEAEGYTRHTVQWYNKQILSKTGCRTRGELVRQLSRTLASLLNRR